jgi:hypothetical protein
MFHGWNDAALLDAREVPLLVLAVAAARGQSPTGTLAGRIADAQSLLVPGVMCFSVNNFEQHFEHCDT